MDIHFSCPACGASFKAMPSQVGTKFPCRQCGQRIEVPRSPQTKTVLGQIAEPAPIVEIVEPVYPVAQIAPPSDDEYEYVYDYRERPSERGDICGILSCLFGALSVFVPICLGMILALIAIALGTISVCTRRQKALGIIGLLLSVVAIAMIIFVWEMRLERLNRFNF